MELLLLAGPLLHNGKYMYIERDVVNEIALVLGLNEHLSDELLGSLLLHVCKWYRNPGPTLTVWKLCYTVLFVWCTCITRIRDIVSVGT